MNIQYIKSFIALLSALLVFISSSVGGQTSPQGAVLTETQPFVLVDMAVRAQGITTDGECYYFSSNFFLTKTTFEGETLVSNLAAIPADLFASGCDHIGGITYYNGKIYAPLEDGDEYLTPYILIFDADTLKFTGKKQLLARELLPDGVPWCAADAERGLLYTSRWSHAAELCVYDLETLEFIKTVPLTDESGNPAQLDRIQGAEVFDGTLYCSSDIHDGQPVFSVNPESGVVSLLFTRGFTTRTEAEGMTVLTSEDGSPVFVSMDLTRDNMKLPWSMNIRKYILK